MTFQRVTRDSHRQPRLACIAVIAVCIGCSVLAVADGFEPNDTLATASPAPFSPNFDVYIGALSVGNGEHVELDVDLFAIVVPDEWTLPVSLTARAVAAETSTDLMLRLFDANGLELANNDDSNDILPFTPFLSTLLLSHGTYYVGVSSAGNPIYDPHTGGTGRSAPGGAYDLNLSGGTTNYPTSLYEPNDTSGAATLMGSGSFAVTSEWIGDNAFGRLDVDVYKITLMQPARLDINAKSADGLFDPVIRVRSCEDPLPTPTTMDDCSLGSADDLSDGTTDARLATAMFEPGDVFIMVSGSGNRGFNPAIAGSGEPGSVGSYELTVTVTPLGPGLPDEPNDAILMATQTPLLMEGRPDSFSIDAFLGDGPYALLRGDRDFYALRLIESQIVSITIEAGSLGSSLVPVLIAYDSRGRMLAYADASSTGGDATLTLPAGCILPLSESEPSLNLMVMGIKQRLPNNLFDPLFWYQSTLIGEHIVEDGPGSTGAYRLTVAVQESDAGCAIEPNDSVSTATETGLVDEGFYFCADLFWGDSPCAQPQADVDIWTFEVTHPPVRFRAEASDCDAFEPFDLRLYDAAGNELAMIDGDIGLGQTGTSIVLTAELLTAQRYFLVASSGDASLNINNPCSCSCWSAEAPYDISITLSPLRSLARNEVVAAGEGLAENELLFATSLDPESPGIDVYDSVSGTIVSHMTSPEPQIGGTGGMAFNGANLFFLGAGRFPRFYKMNAVTSEVLDQYFLWIGSGYYTGAAMLGQEMYLLDHRRRQVHVVDPVTPRYIRSLPLGLMHDITIGGGVAALSGPNRLYVADAFNTEAIYEIHPASGAITGTLAALDSRPTAIAGLHDQLFVADFRTQVMEVRNRSDGPFSEVPLVAPVGMLASFAASIPEFDIDEDGDVDLHDVGAFQLCFHQKNETVPCGITDYDNNDFVDLMDAIYLGDFITGP